MTRSNKALSYRMAKLEVKRAYYVIVRCYKLAKVALRIAKLRLVVPYQALTTKKYLSILFVAFM